MQDTSALPALPAGPNLMIGAIIPTYNHLSALPRIVAALRNHGLPVIIVDDGNTGDAQLRLSDLDRPGEGVSVVRRMKNGGKGAAMKTGFAQAAQRGWTHAVQVDADGQHDLGALPQLLSLAGANPEAVVCAVPVYDSTIPLGRRIGREITHLWVRIETLSFEITDSMCGFRIYPLGDTIAVIEREFLGNRMDFDTEILVQLNWRGVRCAECPVKVIYPEGNYSNFRMLRDNIRISAMHTRLAVQAPVRVVIREARRLWMRRYPKIARPPTKVHDA